MRNLIEHALRHERISVAACLLAVTALAWAYLATGAGTMQDMGGMAMPMSIWPWTPAHAAMMFVMWLVMMTAMMLPGAAPVILLYGTIARREDAGMRAAPAFFTLGYLAAWSGYSVAALLAQFVLEWTQLLSPMMEAASGVLSGALLIAAGLYQFTPLKRSCLDSCRSPLEFLSTHWRPGKRGAFLMGARHGVYCVGCCWGLMLLLFVGGLMNLLWIAGLALFILIEKLAPGGLWLGRALGVLLMAGGAAVLLRALDEAPI